MNKQITFELSTNQIYCRVCKTYSAELKYPVSVDVALEFMNKFVAEHISCEQSLGETQ